MADPQEWKDVYITLAPEVKDRLAKYFLWTMSSSNDPADYEPVLPDPDVIVGDK